MLTISQRSGLTRTALTCLLALGFFGGPSVGSRSPAAIAGELTMDERSWSRGNIPSLTFTVRTGRGLPQKVLAYLYFSDEPGAFADPDAYTIFAGEIPVPGSISVPALPPPYRFHPITDLTPERFIQGAIFDLSDGLVDVTNEVYLDIVYSGLPTVYQLDIETEDDFATALVNGQSISTPPEFGNLVSISALQPPTGAQHFGPAAFDSSPAGPNAEAEDQDLLVDVGNVLILQENGVQNTPGTFDKPDDAANGGTLVFDFTGFDFLEKVAPESLFLIDIDADAPAAPVQPTSVTITLTDVLGKTRVYTIPQGWTEDVTRFPDAGVRKLSLVTLDPQPGFLATAVATATEQPDYLPGEIVRMEVKLEGSGAIDNVTFSKEADPIPGPPPSLRGNGTGGTRPVSWR